MNSQTAVVEQRTDVEPSVNSQPRLPGLGGERLSANEALSAIILWQNNLADYSKDSRLDPDTILLDIVSAIGYLTHAQKSLISELNKAFKS